MKKNTIVVHVIVKNEEKWIWYGINSVLKYVNKIFIYDTGSTDNTLRIIKSIKDPKIILEKKRNVDAKGLALLRDEMIKRTRSEWIMILDGDEVWSDRGMKEVVNTIRKNKKGIQGIIVGHWLCMGDIYHYSANNERLEHKYAPAGYKGWRSLRIIKNIPGLTCQGNYPDEAYKDSLGNLISEKGKDNLAFLKERYFHMSLLPRSSRDLDRKVLFRAPKRHYFLGAPFPKTIEYPNVFYLKRPFFVESPWRKFKVKDKLEGYYFRLLNLGIFIPFYIKKYIKDVNMKLE